jgi:hypothetical protein
MNSPDQHKTPLKIVWLFSAASTLLTARLLFAETIKTPGVFPTYGRPVENMALRTYKCSAELMRLFARASNARLHRGYW